MLFGLFHTGPQAVAQDAPAPTNPESLVITSASGTAVDVRAPLSETEIQDLAPLDVIEEASAARCAAGVA